MLERAIAARGGRPVFVVDLGVPRNVAAESSGLYNLYLYNIDDLGEIVEQNKRAREAEIPRAEALITEHVAKFEAWRTALEAGSIVEDLRGRFRKHREVLLRERLRRNEESFAGGAPAPFPHHRGTDRARPRRTRRTPAQRPRNARPAAGAIEALRHLFGIDRDTDKGGKGGSGE